MKNNRNYYYIIQSIVIIVLYRSIYFVGGSQYICFSFPASQSHSRASTVTTTGTSCIISYKLLTRILLFYHDDNNNNNIVCSLRVTKEYYAHTSRGGGRKIRLTGDFFLLGARKKNKADAICSRQAKRYKFGRYTKRIITTFPRLYYFFDIFGSYINWRPAYGHYIL